MRLVAFFLIFGVCCRAQRTEDQVAATLKQLERAEQTGDANAWIALWARGSAANAEKMRAYIRPRPEQRYQASAIYAQGDEAVILAQAAVGSFVTLTFVREDEAWKIKDEKWRDTAANPNSVYALLPPAGGAFLNAGSPWDQAAPAVDANQAARQGWQVRAIFDESFLYVRIEARDPLPAPGSTIVRPPGGWPVMKIGIAGAGDFVLFDSVNVGDQATFDQSGKANSHRAYASYLMRLEHNDREIFTTWADLETNRLIEVSGRNFEIRIPLRLMGITDVRAAKITIGDAQWPKSVFFSATVARYPR